MLVDRGRCDEHKFGWGGGLTGAERGYGASWTALSREHLRAFPMCQYCGDCPASQTDHGIPKAEGGTSDWSNLFSVCSGPGTCGCHKKKTAEERKRGLQRAAKRRAAG